MAAPNHRCLCCGLATKRDRHLILSCQAVLPALVQLLDQAMLESGVESPTAHILECTPCIYLCKKCHTLIQRYSILQKELKGNLKVAIESGLVSTSTIQPGAKRPQPKLDHHSAIPKDIDMSVSNNNLLN